MLSNENFYERTLLHFAELYLLLGVIELRLRARIPATLSEYGVSIDRAPWWFLLPENSSQRVRILRAIAKNNGEIENFERYLSLRFWRDIFRGKCFRNLWTPALHRVFNGLQNPLDANSYSKVVVHLDRAVEIRNRVAHFDSSGLRAFSREEKTLRWLVEALGGWGGEG